MRRIAVIFILLFSFVLCSCDKVSTSNLEIRGNDTIEVGYSCEYKVYLDGEELTSDDIYWVIDNNVSVAREKNTLYGLSVGEVNLKAVFKSDGKVYCNKKIKIIDSIVERITLRNAKTQINVGDEFTVSVSTEPSEALDYVDTEWSTDNSEVIYIDGSFDSAVITGLKEGVAIITAKCSSATASFTVNVKKPITEIEMYNDDEVCLSSVLSLEFNIQKPVIEVLTDNGEIVDNYLIGLKEGVCKIKVSEKNNKKLETRVFTINVTSDNKSIPDATSSEMEEINKYFNSMSLKEKLGQMFIMDLQTVQSGWRIVKYTFELDEKGLYYYANNDYTTKQYVESMLKAYPFSNLRLDPSLATISSNLSNIVLGMQQYFIKKAKIGGIVELINDEERELTEAFNTYIHNLTLGTINDFNVVKTYYTYLASDLASAGINTFSTHAYTYSDSSLYNYSSLIDKQILYSSVFQNALNNANIALSPIISFSNKESSLIQSAINNKTEVLSISGNGAGNASDKSIAEILRDANYNGLILDIDDHYDGERRYEYENSWDWDYDIYYDLDYYLNAIRKGVDMFKLNMYLECSSDRRNYRNIAKNQETFNFLASLENAVSSDTALLNKVNNAVKKILLYKLRNNIIDGTYPSDDYEPNSESEKYYRSIDDGYNTISIKGRLNTISKNDEVNVFYESDSDLTDLLTKVVSSKGYRNMRRYELNYTNLEGNTYNKISEGSTSVLLITGSYFTAIYPITVTGSDGESYTYSDYKNIEYKEVIDKILEKTDNLILVFLDDPKDENTYSEYNLVKVYLNYGGWDDLNPLFTVLEKNNANGVTLDQK